MPPARTDRDLVVVLDDAPAVAPGIDLRRHVPRLALEWDDDADGRWWQQVDASLVFADISGFTALTEKLATRGRIGAEELIETLNRVFCAMLEEAAVRGGELLKFGGDALLFVFRGDDHQARACRSAVDMRQALREAAKIPTSLIARRARRKGRGHRRCRRQLRRLSRRSPFPLYPRRRWSGWSGRRRGSRSPRSGRRRPADGFPSWKVR